MGMAKKKPNKKLTVETLTHDEATRKNIPTAEYQSVVAKEVESPIRVAYKRGATGLDEEKQRRNRDLDPQLVWRGKDEQDWSDLVVQAPPLYIQEKVHPKVLIDDLLHRSQADKKETEPQLDLFADFNGLPSESARTEFYQHDANWSNRMILGDSLQVMASLAEREGLRGKVQCIFFDPPYGIKFNSNFQWSTTSRDVTDGKVDHITREPEQVKAFRDTWRDGVHSYLTYLRDRLTLERDLLAESGSIFVQIGDENVHRVRALMDEVFGSQNAVATIPFKKTSALGGRYLDVINDTLLLYAKDRDKLKYRQLFHETGDDTYSFPNVEESLCQWHRLTSKEKLFFGQSSGRLFRTDNITSQSGGEKSAFPVFIEGKTLYPSKGSFWKTNERGMLRLARAGRLKAIGSTLTYTRYQQDFPVRGLTAWWDDTIQSTFATENFYVVQTYTKVIQRCILMSTDPGDLVLDPTCGSGTTTYVSEQWGRRWITIDTSRVALALARARIMGARYQYYLLADGRDGQLKEAEVTRTAPSSQSTRGDIRQGFVYERVPHITLKSIANNAEIDVIWEKFQEKLEPLREKLNSALGWVSPSPQPSPAGGEGKKRLWEEWEIPREADDKWSEEAKELHTQWWQQRIGRQKEIDASIAAKAEFEFLYDKPYADKKTVRVAGPFTVESLSPHRVLGVDENDDLIDGLADPKAGYGGERDFTRMILENLKTSGVQQAHKEDKMVFTSLTPWPGELICAEGRYLEGVSLEPSPSGERGHSLPRTRYGGEGDLIEKRTAIFIGPEFGTVSRPDLVAAAREAGDGGFDVLITCAFNYDAHSSEFNKLGRIPVLKARMNADLHMADDLKNTGKGNLFVIFGEPDIDILDAANGQIQVKVNGVDVFHPTTGEVRSDGPDGIACWFIDTDYNEESFFVRHAYFLGANDPYKSLKTTLKAEVNEEAWATLNSDTSRAFPKPKSGRIAVKVINHLGDEVMKVFKT
jgi:adenine-specific DNA-methyltransferase